ncbi:hypothetical protein GCM10023323_16760 [Streptomyces thinghirensis]|uniref:Lamin tail domain-containing protein n=1 Tax=Streptomyces thinghirensis TaxID=551547 RepID=A0ABP9T0Y8_9ACTN
MAVDEAPVARLRVQNNGEDLLELILEPYGSDHWLVPGETFVVWTFGSPDGDPWSGTTHGNEPFQVDYRCGSVTVHSNGSHCYVADVEGTEIECGHRRPITDETAVMSGAADQAVSSGHPPQRVPFSLRMRARSRRLAATMSGWRALASRRRR